MCTIVSVIVSALILRAGAFSGQPQSSKNPVRVLVTGAAGKTGRIVLSKLEKDHRYEPKGLFRTEQSAKNVVKNADTLCPLEHVVVADVTSSTFLQDLSEGASKEIDMEGDESNNINSIDTTSIQSKSNNGLENMEAMIICTSAVPRIQKRSLATMLVKAPWRALRGKPAIDVHSMRFAWKHGGYPEKVDYQGQIAQIDLAKKLGIPHVILLSSMGGTDPDNFLNSVGKSTTKLFNEEEGHGDILLWKRRAEKYLVESGLDYTILHPGHLVDSRGGLEEFVLGVDDELHDLIHHSNSNSNSNITSSTKMGSLNRISREDVAELCVAALSVGKGKKISFDCITVSPSSISSSVPKLRSPQRKTRRRRQRVEASTSTKTATSGASTLTVSEATVEVRKPAEEVLNEFLDLSISTNYDKVP